jgi:hypothetical protein
MVLKLAQMAKLSPPFTSATKLRAATELRMLGYINRRQARDAPLNWHKCGDMNRRCGANGNFLNRHDTKNAKHKRKAYPRRSNGTEAQRKGKKKA